MSRACEPELRAVVKAVVKPVIHDARARLPIVSFIATGTGRQDAIERPELLRYMKEPQDREANSSWRRLRRRSRLVFYNSVKFNTQALEIIRVTTRVRSLE